MESMTLTPSVPATGSAKAYAVTVIMTFVIGWSLLFFTLFDFVLSSRSGRWPETEGVVTVSRMYRHSDEDSHSVIYRYSVNGLPYSSSRIHFFQITSHSISQAIVNRYPLGSTVNVHYDPQNPQRAILESTPYANGFLQLIAALLFLFAWRWALKKAKAADALAPAQRAAPPDVEARLNLLIRQGNKMEAIVLCRTSRGMGLKEAKDYVEAVSRAKPSEDLDFRLRSLLKQGKMIDAIKLCHSEGGFDLKDAKEYVESLDAPSGPPIIKE